MFVEVFQPFQTSLIVCPSITYRFNNPIVREVGFGVPVREVVDALNDQKWRDIPTFAINAHNCCRPFPIAWLYSLGSATSIGTCNNHPRCDLTHYKAGLVEVVEIAVYYPIFRPHILY
jgi:hypothetical protein